MKMLNFYIHDDLRERMIDCAWKARMNKSEFIREAIIRFCEEIESNERVNSNRGT